MRAAKPWEASLPCLLKSAEFKDEQRQHGAEYGSRNKLESHHSVGKNAHETEAQDEPGNNEPHQGLARVPCLPEIQGETALDEHERNRQRDE